jgi:hypothetical protein
MLEVFPAREPPMTAKRMTKADLPHSMGAFKPVGHVLNAFPDETRAGDAVQVLRARGFVDEDFIELSCKEMCSRMERMLGHTSEFAGFGYEVVLMRRYKAICDKGGCNWLLVYAPDEAHAQYVAEVARRFEALSSVRYGRLVEEEFV